MGQAIAVRTDFTAGEVRQFAKRARDAAQARRLLAIAAVLDGVSREDAAKIGGMDRQTLRDWVIRFNEQGPDGLINIPSPGVPVLPKLGKKHRSFLVRLVEEGPIPAVHGVVRWRACDLIMRLHEEFGLASPSRSRSAHPIDLLVRCGMSRTRNRRCSRPPFLPQVQYEVKFLQNRIMDMIVLLSPRKCVHTIRDERCHNTIPIEPQSSRVNIGNGIARRQCPGWKQRPLSRFLVPCTTHPNFSEMSGMWISNK